MADPFDTEIREWPDDVEARYERFEVLGKGSFGMVWMSRRVGIPENDDDDEFVAIKEIKIKDEKSEVYAEREISILNELKHPNVIRLIRAYPVHKGSRVVVMQLARGPNLHQLVVKRGALGLPLARLVSRQLISAVSYLHGRAIIHRDIKPSNCILACTANKPTDAYNWYKDDAIWSNKEDGVNAVQEGKWKLYLVDFGFARALEIKEIETQPRRMRNSIMFETNIKANSLNGQDRRSSKRQPMGRLDSDDDSFGSDDEALEKMVERAAKDMRRTSFEATSIQEDQIMGASTSARKRMSGVSMPIPESPIKAPGARGHHRMSHARHNVRSMSALGTKAYAAPEIRKQLRQKTEEDFEKDNAAMTECVADYGMIVDAYSVGWTLRVAITGVPPNFTISEYMNERDTVVLEGSEEEISPGCCCLPTKPRSSVVVRDPSMIPKEATLLITAMVEKNPEDRMTVREAQNHPYIAGGPDEPTYEPPHGDIPSKHGDPVIPLKCAADLSKLTIQYHMT